MKKRLCDIDIWQKDWFLDLPDKKKLLVKFLYDNCDCAGVYEISWRMLRLFFSESICREDFLDLKQIRFIDENTIFIEDFISFQYGISDFNKLNPNNNVHKGILKVLKKYNIFEPLGNSSLTLNQPLGNSCPTVLDMDKDKVKDKEEDNTSNLLKEEEIKKEEEKVFSNNSIDPYTDTRLEKYFDCYKDNCKDLTPIRFERRNAHIREALARFIIEIDNDVGYFEELCKKANKQKEICGKTIDFKMLINNHIGLSNEKYNDNNTFSYEDYLKNEA